MDSTGALPDIRFFQMDSVDTGNVSKSVNRFRGDVNLTIDLVSLPGASGPSTTISIFYQSNVQTQVGRWALEAPTGVVGLGWALPVDAITRVPGPAALVAPTYTLLREANAYPLVRTDDPWRRAALPTALASALDAAIGGALPATVQAALAADGLALDATTYVAGASGAWTLIDPVHELVLAVRAADDALHVEDAGQGYQIAAYRFWQIRFYDHRPAAGEPAAFTRWEITDEHGVATSYGAAAAQDEHAQQWSVGWAARDAEDPSFAGPSSELTGQRRYPAAWNRDAVRSPWGEATRFTYNSDGLDAVAMRRVGGDTGLRYTQASYLTRVTDPFGRTVHFHYRPKRFDPQGIREYLDPHQPLDAVPDDRPRAYQDTYETHYLHSLSVRTASGALIQTIELDYRLLPPWGVPRDTVAHPFSYKRTLTSVTYRTPAGQAQPPLLFDYHEDDAPGAQPGALATMTYPSGAVVSYAYTRTRLPLCDRAVTDTRPADLPDSALPGVYYGPTYAVTVWSSQTSAAATAYTWNGRWMRHPLALDPGVVITQVIPAADLTAIVAADGDLTALYPIHQDPRRTGTWLAPVVDGAPGPIVIPAQAGMVTVVAGEDFVAWTVAGSAEVGVATWDWRTQTFTTQAAQTAASDAIQVVAVGRALLVTAQSGDVLTLTLSYLDATGRWHAAVDTATETPVTVIDGSLTWTPGVAMAAASWLAADDDDGYCWGLLAVRWDARYRFQPILATGGTTTYPQSVVPLPPAAIFDDTLVSVGPFFARWTGRGWAYHQSRVIDNLAAGSVTFSLGADLGVISVSTGTTANATLVVFDAAQHGEDRPWREHALKPGTVGGTTAGTDTFTFEQNVYSRYQAPGATWAAALDAAPAALTGAIPATVLLEDQAYVAFVTEDAGELRASTMLLANGGLVAPRPAFVDEVYALSGGAVLTAPGQTPGGPAMLTTFPATATWTSTDKLTLRRVVGRAMNDAITTFPVTQISAAVGGQAYVTQLAYDAARTACDPSALVAMHFRVTTTVFQDPASTQPAGTRESRYLNTAAIADAWDVLQGLELGETSTNADGTVVSVTEHTWSAATPGVGAARELLDGSGRVIALVGGFAQQVATRTTLDGLTTDSWYGYVPDGRSAPVTPNPASARSRLHGSRGELETWAQLTTAGAERYEALGRTNRLIDVAMSATAVERAGDRQATSADVNVLAGWPAASGATVLASAAAYRFLGGATIAHFDEWNGEPPGPRWLPVRTITGRTSLGRVTEERDASGMATSYIYDAVQHDVVATFVDASLAAGEAGAYGAEPYEVAGPWTIPTGTIATGDAHTGTAAIAVATGATGPGAAFVIARDQPYLFSFWSKLPAGASGEASWTVTVGTTAHTVTAIASGAWRYGSLAVSAPPGTAVTIASRNAASATWLVDDLRFAPIAATTTTFVFDPVFARLTATMAAGRATARIAYDRFWEPILETDAAGNPTKLVQISLSRTRNPSFAPGDPNHTLLVLPAGGGLLEGFTDGDGWTARWTATGSWTATTGQITSPAGAAALTSPVAGESLYVQATPSTAPTGPLGLALSETAQAVWSPTAQAWQLATWTDGAWTVVATAAGTPPTAGAPAEWLLLRADDDVVFFVDGVRLFSTRVAGRGHAQIVASDPVVFANPTRFARPDATMTFTNGAGQRIQRQQLGDDAPVVGWLYDGRARVLAEAKAIPAGFGTGHGLAPLAFRPGYLTGWDPTTWQVTGDVADYYRGHHGASDDGGYPFAGTAYEASPLDRVIGRGAPGADLALRPDRGHPTRLTYGTNPAVLGLPAGAYQAHTVIDPDGVAHVQLRDTTGRTIAALDTAATGTRATRYDWDFGRDGLELVQWLPNAFVPPTGEAASPSVRRFRLDYAGRTRISADDDGGTVHTALDAMHRVRAVRTALGAAAPEPYIAYWKYDSRGRLIERGWLATDASPAELDRLAEDPRWPDGPRAWQVRLEWDGDGRQPDALGRLVRAISAGPPLVTEHFGYDARGNAIRHALTLDDPELGGPHLTHYAHDNLGRIERIDYPGGALSVRVGRDAAGRVTAIGDEGAPTRFAAYGYDGSSLLARETVGGTTTTFAYAGPSWLRAIDGPAFSAAYDYTPPQVRAGDPRARTGAWSGTLGRATFAYGDALPASAMAFGWDFAKRLSSARGTPARAAIDAIQYDGNGNQVRVIAGGRVEAAELARGSDLVTALGERRYGYDANGRVVTITGGGPALALTRDVVTGLPTQVVVDGGATVALGYARDQRVLKTVTEAGVTTRRLYLRGVGDVPLVELTARGGAITAQHYVRGPRGLVALIDGGAPLAIVVDHQGSPRAVLDAAGRTVGAYHYGPFGALVGQHGDVPLRYLYTGQEYDAETGLYNFRARTYDPALRRFLEIDPAREGFSPFVFLANDPLLRIDPDGRLSKSAGEGIGAGLLVVGFVVAFLSTPVPLLTYLPGLISGYFMGAGSTLLSESIQSRTRRLQNNVFLDAFVSGGFGGVVSAGGAELADAKIFFNMELAPLTARQLVSHVVANAVAGAISNVGSDALTAAWHKVPAQQFLVSAVAGFLVGGATDTLTGATFDKFANWLAQDKGVSFLKPPWRSAWDTTWEALSRNPSTWGPWASVAGHALIRGTLRVIVAAGIAAGADALSSAILGKDVNAFSTILGRGALGGTGGGLVARQLQDPPVRFTGGDDIIHVSPTSSIVLG